MLNIAPALYGQSDKYIRVWLYVFFHIATGNNKICVGDIIKECAITRQSFYEIINRGVRVFNENGIVLSIHREHLTDKYIIINTSIEKSIVQQPIKAEQPKEKPTKSINEQQGLAINAIITYLNEVTNKHYTTTNATTVRLIVARLNNGFTLEQFKYVIDVKAAHWMNTEMEKFLRPETLFGNKFEGYLNETITTNQQGDSTAKRIRTAQESVERDWGI